MPEGDLFECNLAALVRRSPEVAQRLGLETPDPSLRLRTARSGAPILERSGRPLESRHDPVAAAEVAAGAVGSARVVVAGFGAGYLCEALLARGVTVVAVVVSSLAELRVVLQTRDLTRVLATVPLLSIETLRDPADLAAVRAGAEDIVPHGPSLAVSPELGALVTAWSSMRVATRRPRLLVVGPVYGGSLEVARSMARAGTVWGADVRFFDASAYGEAYHALGGLESTARQDLQGRLVSLVGDATVSVAAQWRPDVVLALAQAPLGPSEIDRLRELGAATAFWFVENGRVLPYWRDVAASYEWFYAIQPGRFLDQLAEAGAKRPRYLPMACDPEVHVPVDLTADDRQRFGADVSFAGSPYLNRRRVFAGLTDFELKLWGPGWTDPLLSGCVAGDGRHFSPEEMVRICQATRINLNLHSAEHVEGLDPEPDYVNPRTFELAGCGAFQLVDRRDPLPELFAADAVITFSTAAELRALIRHYLANEDERGTVARRARVEVLARHTYLHRIDRLLRDTLAPELAGAALAGVTVETLEEAIARFERDSPSLVPDEALLRIVREVQHTFLSPQ